MKRETLSALKKCMHPHPVYVAQLDDGRTVRMTVWQSVNAPEKGYDWQACRNTVLHTSDWSQKPVRTYCSGHFFTMPPMLRETGRKIVSAHLEQAGAVLSKDPEFHHDAKCLGRDFGKRKAKHGKASTLRHSLDAILNAKGKAAREQAITNARWLLSVNDGKRAMAEAAD